MLLGDDNLNITGNIKDDLRAAAGKIKIAQDVLDDVILANGEVEMR
ncbi:hypothetical protein [Adhaeribacter rhizoryzae]|nr:hypothetical protein [Adhaeribacter rhizoryzae]